VKILVVGAGAVGSLFGARLAGAGNEVELVGRSDHILAVRSHGLRVEGSAPGTFHPQAFSDIGETSVPDVLLLTVKTFDLGSAARMIARRFPRPMPVLLPQNGLNAGRVAAQALSSSGWAEPTPWIVRAVNSVPVTWVGPGIVRQAGEGELVVRDPRLPDPASGSIAVVLSLFSRAGLPVRKVPDLEREIWRKALVNAAINPVTAIHRVQNGRLLDSPYREEAHRLLREAQLAADAAGFPFTDLEADADLDRVVRATAENRSSMLQDRERGRPTEVDAISGEIERTALAHGIGLPVTRAMIELLRSPTSNASSPTQPS
jgi:2-dehydropantoate 2-reductase